MKQFKCTAAVFLDTLHYRSHMSECQFDVAPVLKHWSSVAI